MIQITNVDIKNYRSCINTRLKVESNLIALIGANGAGKSNILNSFLLLSSSSRFGNTRMYKDRDLNESFTHSIIIFDINLEGKKFKLKAEIYYETNERNSDDIHYLKIQFKQNKKGERYKQVEDILIEYSQYIRSRDFQLSDLPKRFRTKFNNNFLRCFYFIKEASYYSATQYSDPSNCPVSIELDKNKRLPRYKVNGFHDKFLYDLYTVYRQDTSSFNRYLSTIGSNGIGLISDVEFYEYDLPNSTFEVKTGGKIKQIDKERQIIVPSFKIDNAVLSPNQLSEGTFKTIALIFYILNDSSDLMLIEEPEVCIHHGLLNSILELIKFKSSEKQIIISTHSDYVLDKLSPENVILVLKDKEVGTLSVRLGDHLHKEDYASLKKYLNNVGNLGEFWKEGGFDYE